MSKFDGMAPGDPTAGKISICHWANSGHWNQINVSNEALEGHENHQWDIWPAVEGVTDGNNWGRGENVYVNGCETTSGGQPLPSPTVSESSEPTVSPSPTVTVTVTPPPQTDTPSASVTPSPSVTITEAPSLTPTPTETPCLTPTGANTAILAIAMLGTAALIRWRK